MKKIPTTADGAAFFLWAVALTLRESDQQNRPLTGKTFVEIVGMHVDSLVDGTSPYLLHRALSPRDVGTVIAMQKFLQEAYESDDLDFLIP